MSPPARTSQPHIGVTRRSTKTYPCTHNNTITIIHRSFKTYSVWMIYSISRIRFEVYIFVHFLLREVEEIIIRIKSFYGIMNLVKFFLELWFIVKDSCSNLWFLCFSCYLNVINSTTFYHFPLKWSNRFLLLL